MANITGAASSEEDAINTAERPKYADGARSRVSVLSMPFQPALSKTRVELSGKPDKIMGSRESVWRWRGLDGIEWGDDDVDEDPDLTTIVSTIPITRAASVNMGPVPALRLEKNELFLVMV